MKKLDRKRCGEVIDGFVAEINADRPLGFVRHFVSPSQSPNDVFGCAFTASGDVSDFFRCLQTDMRRAGEQGDWKRVAWLAMTHAQYASSLGFDFVIDAKKQQKRKLAANRDIRRSNERPRIDDRNEKILREWRTYKHSSVRAFHLWMQDVRHPQLTSKDRPDRDPKFAKQLKPHGSFLGYDVFRTLIPREVRLQKTKR
jgi:hypothetical protein